MSLPRTLASVARGIESDLANPVVGAVLRSRFHSLLSRWLLLLAYEGRRTGRRYTTPTLYRLRNDGVVLFTPSAATNWWRNFRTGHPASVLLRGEWRQGTGVVVSDDDAVLVHLRREVEPIRRFGRVLGRRWPGDARVRRLARSLVVVRISLGEPSEHGPRDS